RFFGNDGANDSATPRVAFRDTILLGDLLMVFDVGARLNLDLGDGDAPGSRFVGFTEGSVLAFAGYEVLESARVFLGVDLRVRGFDEFLGDGERERTVRAFGGVRYRIGPAEVHAEYGYSRSSGARDFQRNIASGGVRWWF
ncbi:MAG: hypothetical protein AAF658_13625, partial [Myxococcota bacterium]